MSINIFITFLIYRFLDNRRICIIKSKNVRNEEKKQQFKVIFLSLFTRKMSELVWETACRGTNYKWYTLNFAKPTFNLFKKFAAKKCMKKNHTHTPMVKARPLTHTHTHTHTYILAPKYSYLYTPFQGSCWLY